MSAPPLQFVSAIIQPRVPVVLSATAPRGLVVSNVCIPDVPDGAPMQPCRLFGTVVPSAGDRVLLATLLPNRAESESIGFRVAPGKQIKLETGGPYPVHVAGYLQDPGDDDFNESDEEEDDL
jgi:hypothetical protein